MRYFFDTEFIDDGYQIDLISIGIESETGAELYLQNCDCKFDRANDFVGRHVYTKLKEFDMGSRRRTCQKYDIPLGDVDAQLDGCCYAKAACSWRDRSAIRESIKKFIGDNKPEFWAYFCSYDWVAFCQLFGKMIDLPKHYPHYCNDIIQWCKQLGNPTLPPKPTYEHNALEDARWVKQCYDFLQKYEKEKGR